MWEFAIFVVVFIVVSVIGRAKKQSQPANGRPNPRVQKLIERIQEQGGNVPVQLQGQFTRAAGPSGPRQPRPAKTAAPRQTPYASPAQQPPPVPPQPSLQYQPPVQYNSGPYRPAGHRPQQNNLPASNQDVDARVRRLMESGNEVGAVRLLSDERDLGILEAQRYARSLVAPKAASGSAELPEPDDADQRYVGSAAIAESIFNLDDPDENVWASGWVDEAEPEDRSDIDELWQTVSNPPRPGTAEPSS
jgi:hypothetical protein